MSQFAPLLFAVLLSFCFSFCSWVSWAQTEPTASMKLAEEMEKAQTLADVVQVLKETSKTEFGATELLMIYNRIPENLLNLSTSLTKIQSADVTSEDRPVLVELIYLVHLESQLQGPNARRDKKFIQNQFFKRLMSWHGQLRLVNWQEQLQDHAKLTDHEITSSSETKALPMVERIVHFSNTLIDALDPSHYEYLENKMQIFLKQNRKEKSGAIKAVPRTGQDKKNRRASWVTGALSAAMGTPVMLAPWLPNTIGHSAGGLLFTGSLAFMLITPFLADTYDKDRQNRINSINVLFADRKVFLELFFKPIQNIPVQCAKATR